jgi:hypothetical protein
LFIAGSWKTVWISYRQKTNSTIYIGEQMRDRGARGYSMRMVKVIPVTPLLDWVKPIDTTNLGSEWREVSESYNPFNLK